MNKPIITIFFILATMISCKQSNKQGQNQDFNTKFLTYLERIDSVSLPYSASCFDFIDLENTGKYADLIDTTYASEWELPYGKIKTNGNYKIVIYLCPADIFVPIMRTFDLKGKRISEFKFFTNCGGEPGFRERQFVNINNDFQIIKKDSIWRWDLDQNHNEIDSTMKIKVIETILTIDENGLIK
ncbi:hypothetical protein [Maribellus sediminis]|uniref:hypothetical protein n=1 Tax=Maribellus sediminis TaxID=2696285 RepID=UPI0014315455|nr:hypothetical protein [Maribellus sediminis]